jgi:hypothetical protein
MRKQPFIKLKCSHNMHMLVFNQLMVNNSSFIQFQLSSAQENLKIMELVCMDRFNVCLSREFLIFLLIMELFIMKMIHIVYYPSHKYQWMVVIQKIIQY